LSVELSLMTHTSAASRPPLLRFNAYGI
jgi:hypothetical protein